MRSLLPTVLLLTLSGCMSSTEKNRVHQASLVSREAAKKFDAKTPDKDVRLFLDNNANAWEEFDSAVNGVKGIKRSYVKQP